MYPVCKNSNAKGWQANRTLGRPGPLPTVCTWWVHCAGFFKTKNALFVQPHASVGASLKEQVVTKPNECFDSFHQLWTQTISFHQPERIIHCFISSSVSLLYYCNAMNSYFCQYAKAALAVLALRLWNSLPLKVRSADCFRLTLKTCFFSKVFYWCLVFYLGNWFIIWFCLLIDLFKALLTHFLLTVLVCMSHSLTFVSTICLDRFKEKKIKSCGFKQWIFAQTCVCMGEAAGASSRADCVNISLKLVLDS